MIALSRVDDIFSKNIASDLLNDDDKDYKNDVDIDFNISLALVQQQMENEQDETKKNQLEKDYNEMLSCVYDENGNKIYNQKFSTVTHGINLSSIEYLEKLGYIKLDSIEADFKPDSIDEWVTSRKKDENGEIKELHPDFYLIMPLV